MPSVGPAPRGSRGYAQGHEDSGTAARIDALIEAVEDVVEDELEDEDMAEESNQPLL